MRILYLITRAERGGGQIHVVDLLRAFSESMELSVASGESNGYLADEAKELGVPFHWIPDLVQPISPRNDAKALLQTVSLLRKLKPDLIHAHTSKAGFIGRIAAKITNIPVVFTAHTWSFAEGISAKQRMISVPLERLAARVPGRIITVSEANRRLALERGISTPRKMSTVWNGTADNDLRSNTRRQAPVEIIMVARFAPQKNQALLLRALAQTGGDFHLNLVGDGPTQKNVEAVCDELGLRARVAFLGDRGDVPHLLAQSQIFALSTNWEGLPYSIIEAMRSGLPVVATDVGGIRECVIDGQTGLLCAPGSLESLRDQLSRLMQSPDLRHQLGTAGRALYEQSFTLDSMAASTHAVYVDALRQPTIYGTAAPAARSTAQSGSIQPDKERLRKAL